jgi:hypothetical protein
VHNSSFDLAFHGWREPLENGIALATPEIGEVLTLGKGRENRKWWGLAVALLSQFVPVEVVRG